MSVETHFRIVINPSRPANESGSFPWQCTLCGAAVAHVDRHAEWHLRTDGISYGSLIRAIDGDATFKAAAHD